MKKMSRAMMKLWHVLDIRQSSPTPFPLAQMCRVFVLVYLLILPFILVQQLEEWSYLFISLVTYGFWGMAMVSDEMDDPFGKDANDLDIQGSVDECFAAIAELYHLPKPEAFEML